MTDHSTYFINQERIEEMVRLKKQAELVTQEMGGLVPEQQEHALPGMYDVLDLACGPGEWVMGLSERYPHLRLVGVDKSRRMIDYASAGAEAEDRPCTFHVMDVTQPLAFPDESFDLINARFLLGFMKREQWPLLLQECARLLRPGGVLRVTEQESGFSNDPAYQHYMDVWGAAWKAAGHAFAHTPAYIGVTVVLKNLMRDAGLINPRHRPIAVDLSTGEPGHQAFLDNFVQALTLAAPFLLHLGVITQQELTELAAQMEQLIGREGFCAYWFLQTIWCQKPPRA